MVAAAAVMGAAGVVALSGKPSDENLAMPGQYEHESIREQTDLFAPKAFHPRTERGQKLGKIAFRFQYTTKDRYRYKVRERITELSVVICDEAMRLFMGRSPHELTSLEGLSVLERDLVRKINDVVFPDRLAQADKILWDQVIVR